MESLPKPLRNAFNGAMEEYKYFEWSMKGQADTLIMLLTWTMLETTQMEKTIPSELQGAIQRALDDYKYFDWSIIGLEGMIKMSLTWKTKNEGCSNQYEIRSPENASTAATQHRPAEPRTHALSGFSADTTRLATMITFDVKSLSGWRCVLTMEKNATIKDLHLVVAAKKSITLSEEEKKNMAALVSSGKFSFKLIFGGRKLRHEGDDIARYVSITGHFVHNPDERSLGLGPKFDFGNAGYCYHKGKFSQRHWLFVRQPYE